MVAFVSGMLTGWVLGALTVALVVVHKVRKIKCGIVEMFRDDK